MYCTCTLCQALTCHQGPQRGPMLGIICYHHLEILSSFIHWFIWLHQVSVVACGIFIKSCGSFCCSAGSLVVSNGLSSCSAQAPEHTGFRSCSMQGQLLLYMWGPSSLTRDQACIPCIGRQTLNLGPPGSPLKFLIFKQGVLHFHFALALIKNVANFVACSVCMYICV